MDFIYYILLGMAIAVVWSFIKDVYYKAKVIAQLREMAEQSEQTTKINFIEAIIKKIDEEYFVYDKYSSKFLAQGKDYETLRERLGSRFPNYQILVDESELDDAGLVIGNSSVDSPRESL